MAPREGLFWRELRPEAESLESVGTQEIDGKYEKSRCFALLQDTGLIE